MISDSKMSNGGDQAVNRVQHDFDFILNSSDEDEEIDVGTFELVNSEDCDENLGANETFGNGSAQESQPVTYHRVLDYLRGRGNRLTTEAQQDPGPLAPEMAPPVEDARTRFTRFCLVHILHARKCALGHPSGHPCPLALCPPAKRFNKHRPACNGRDNCPPTCLFYRRAIDHWENCIQTNCRICAPVKEAASPRLEHQDRIAKWVLEQLDQRDMK